MIKEEKKQIQKEREHVEKEQKERFRRRRN